MASQRPSYSRKDTDGHSLSHTDGVSLRDLPAGSSSKPSTSNPEFHDMGAKDGAQVHVDSDVPDYAKPDHGDIVPPEYIGENDGFNHVSAPVETAKDITTQVLHVDDDPTLNSWTFRMIFLGTGLSIFGSVLQEIFYFKPQTIFVSVVFLTVIAYVLGEFMAYAIPRKGIFRYLNPHSFNKKEHAAITIMASAASQAALSTEALAAQQLYYGGYPSKGAGIFITLSSQLIGFGIAGLMRNVLVYPTKMLWPQNLPIATLLESFHRDKRETKQRLKIFYIGFFTLFVWEVFPEYIFTLMTGVSIFCLADQHNLVFTNLFGGASGNEGLGFLNICFDWNYIASFYSPLWYPLQTTINQMIGIFGCYMLFMGVYYGNLWRSQDFPFLSQSLFDGASNSTNYLVWNQTVVLNSKQEVDFAKLDEVGIPYLTGTYIAYLITTNAGTTATFVHMMLWNFNDIKQGWTWINFTNFKKLFKPSFYLFWRNDESSDAYVEKMMADPEVDAHYKLMLQNGYGETPTWWWGLVLIISWVVGLVCLYIMKSTLPWWGYLLASVLTAVFTLFFAALYGITGFGFNLQPVGQMLAGYMFPGRPLANFYFTCYTYNSNAQAMLLSRDLKLAQYAHLAPKATFFSQIWGCIVGALFNWVMMVSIVQNQSEILVSVQGTNIWSGQNVQQFNTLAIAWSIAGRMFSVGARYQWVTLSFLLGFLVPVPFYIAHRYTGHRFFSYFNCAIILWFMGNLFVGINSSLTTFWIVAFISQWYVRKYKPQAFVKYNYLISAAMDGGTQVMVFILTFAVFGGSGKSVPFPTWAGNPGGNHNIDYCMVNPANDG